MRHILKAEMHDCHLGRSTMSLTLWERTTRTGIPFWHDSNSALFMFSNFWSKDCTCKQMPVLDPYRRMLDCSAGFLQHQLQPCA